jgi:cytochrome c peroxidase
MKKLVVILMMVVCVHAHELAGCKPGRQDAIEQVKQQVAKGIIQLEEHVANALLPAVQGGQQPAKLREEFLKARLLYKQIEWAAEYFMPTTTRFVNGPPLPEIENEENKIQQPEGLQVMEGLLYTGEAIANQELERQASCTGRRWK